jgi:hypothetical protein
MINDVHRAPRVDIEVHELKTEFFPWLLHFKIDLRSHDKQCHVDMVEKVMPKCLCYLKHMH